MGVPRWGRKRVDVSERAGAVAVLIWLLCAVPGRDRTVVSQRLGVGPTMSKT